MPEFIGPDNMAVWLTDSTEAGWPVPPKSPLPGLKGLQQESEGGERYNAAVYRVQAAALAELRNAFRAGGWSPLPAQMVPTQHAFIRLGFVLGELLPADPVIFSEEPMFRWVKPPMGWSLQHSEHPRCLHLHDRSGIARAWIQYAMVPWRRDAAMLLFP